MSVKTLPVNIIAGKKEKTLLNDQWPKAEYIAEVPGTYYIAIVNEGTGPGNYRHSLGFREEFTPAEWILISLSTGNVRVWEGSSKAFVVGFLKEKRDAPDFCPDGDPENSGKKGSVFPNPSSWRIIRR